MYVVCLGPWRGIDYHSRLVGPVAHGDVVRPVYAPHTIIHQTFSTSTLWVTLFPTQFAMINLWVSAVCKCPVSFLSDSELTQSHIVYTAMFLGVRSAILKSVQRRELS